MNISKTKILWDKIYKNINNFNPKYMNELSNLKKVRDWTEKDIG